MTDVQKMLVALDVHQTPENPEGFLAETDENTPMGWVFIRDHLDCYYGLESEFLVALSAINPAESSEPMMTTVRATKAIRQTARDFRSFCEVD